MHAVAQSRPLFLLWVMNFALLITSCSKQDILNTSLLPPEDHILPGTQVYTIQARSARADSIISYNTGLKILGQNMDPEFGETRAGLYLNLNMSSENVSFGSTAAYAYSELIFALDPLMYSGSNTATLNMRVYPLDSALNPSKIYYSNYKTACQGVQWMAVSTPTSQYNAKPVIRIKIDSAYGAALMKDEAALLNNTNLQNTYKGFYIEAFTGNGNPGVLYKMNLNDAVSGYYIRYRKTPQDTLSAFRFAFSGSKAVSYNTINHSYLGGSPVMMNQLDGDFESGKSKLYLKGLGHSKLIVNIPQLKAFSVTDSIYSVNRAELVLYLDRDANTQSGYAPPAKLALVAVDSLQKESFTLDLLNSIDRNRYDGVYDDVAKCYRFNIVKHAQAVLSGKIKNYGFRIQVADPEFIMFKDLLMGRVIFEGSSHATLYPKFLIHYTAIPKPR